MQNLFILFIFSALLISCTNENSQSFYSLDDDSNLLAHCTPFNKKELVGYLSLQGSQGYGNDVTILSFKETPFSLKEVEDAYFQVHGLTYPSQGDVQVSSALSLSIFNPRSEHGSISARVIDIETIYSLTKLDLEDFFLEYDLQVLNTIGYDALYIGIYDSRQNVLDGTHVLLPPYSINPETFYNEHPTKGNLASHHPFIQTFGLAKTAQSDEILLSKLESACR